MSCPSPPSGCPQPDPSSIQELIPLMSEPLSAPSDLTSLSPSPSVDRRTRRRPALVHLGRHRHPRRARALAGLADHRERGDRHRARHPQDRQRSRRPPARAGHRGPIGGDGGQALPRPGESAVPSRCRLHRWPGHPQHPRPPGHGQEHPLGAHRAGRGMGAGRVRIPRRPVVRRAPGALPGATGRRRDLDGVHHPGRRHRLRPGWPRPGRIATCWRATGRSSPRRCG